MKTRIRMIIEGYTVDREFWSNMILDYNKNWRKVKPCKLNYFSFTHDDKEQEEFLKNLLVKAKYRRLFATYSPKNKTLKEIYS